MLLTLEEDWVERTEQHDRAQLSSWQSWTADVLLSANSELILGRESVLKRLLD